MLRNPRKPLGKCLETIVVPINRITLGNDRLLRNFVTLGTGKFQGCDIGLLIILHLKLR